MTLRNRPSRWIASPSPSRQSYLQALFDELNTKVAGNLTPQEFDAGIAKQGNALYEDLFHNAYQGLPGFKTFYRETLYPLSERGAHTARALRAGGADRLRRAVHPLEILRGSLPDAQGRWRAD